MQKAGHHVTSFGTVKLWQSSPSGSTGKIGREDFETVLISSPAILAPSPKLRKMEEVSQNEESLVC